MRNITSILTLYSYPQGFSNLGPYYSTILLLITGFISYITATFMIEVISVSNAMKTTGRTPTLFPDDSYMSEKHLSLVMERDTKNKKSPYYIRQKVEIGKVAQDHGTPAIRVFVIIVMVIYMYGAMCLKYVSGAESFVKAVNSIIYPHDPKGWEKAWPDFDPYYVGLLIFAGLSLAFSFGNIENSKGL